MKSCSIAEKAEFRPVYILEVVRCGQVSQSKKDQYFRMAKSRILQILTKNSIFVHILTTAKLDYANFITKLFLWDVIIAPSPNPRIAFNLG